MDVSQAEEKEQEEEQEEESPLRISPPLPIQVEGRDQTTEECKTPSSQQLSGNSAKSGTIEVLLTPSHNTIPTREEWDQCIELRLQETFQGPSTLDHLD